MIARYSNEEITTVNKCISFLLYVMLNSIFAKIFIVISFQSKFAEYIIVSIFSSHYSTLVKLVMFFVVFMFFAIILTIFFLSLYVFTEEKVMKRNSTTHMKIKICIVVPLLFYIACIGYKYDFELEVGNRK